MSDNTRKKTSFKDLKKQIRPNEYYNHPNNFGEEGDDHLNISIQSKNFLGMLFDPAYLRTIHYPYVGKFSSVMSLWHWVRSSDLDDNFRGLTGRRLKMYAEANGTFGKYVTNFKAIIAQATWIKIKTYPNVVNEIKNFPDDFKFLSYHILSSSELRLCTNYAGLMIEIMTVITKAVKNGEEPNFDCFCDRGADTSLKYLTNVLSKVMPPAKIKAMKEAEIAGKVPTDDEEDADTADEPVAPSTEVITETVTVVAAEDTQPVAVQEDVQEPTETLVESTQEVATVQVPLEEVVS